MIYFEKYHGTGNDFIILDGMNQDYENVTELVQRICDRHYGIGADGLMIVRPSKICDVKMVFYNQDGTIAPMCGNGIRCFARYVVEHGIVNNEVFTVETLAGVMKVEITKRQQGVFYIKINMGQPNFNLSEMAVDLQGTEWINREVRLGDDTYTLSIITMGTLHAVLFVDSIDDIDVNRVGKLIEGHSLFPERINVNFTEVINEKEINVVTYERGAGLTESCGTGSSAAAVISSLVKGTNNKVDVHIPGGTLTIEQVGYDVYMTGPAVFIGKGYYQDQNERCDLYAKS